MDIDHGLGTALYRVLHAATALAHTPVEQCVRPSGTQLVNDQLLVELREAIGACSAAAAIEIVTEAGRESCSMCNGTGRAQFPAFWPAETVGGGPGGDPDDLAVAYASEISRFGGFPRIGFAMSGENIVGIEVRDTRTGSTVEPTRVFTCQPMTLSAPVATGMLAQMIQAAASRAKGPRR